MTAAQRLLFEDQPPSPTLGSLWQVSRPGFRAVLRLESVTADDPTFRYRLRILEIEARNSTLWQVGDSFDVELAWFTKRVDVSPVTSARRAVSSEPGRAVSSEETAGADGTAEILATGRARAASGNCRGGQ